MVVRFLFLQGFQRDLEELEPIESLNGKIADKNVQIRSIQQQISVIGEQQGDLGSEIQQHRDKIR